MKSLFVAILAYFFWTMPAVAQEQSTTIHFANGNQYVFTPVEEHMRGGATYRVYYNGKTVPAEWHDGKRIVTDNEGKVSCFDEPSYDVKTDLIQCNWHDSADTWLMGYYRGTDTLLTLQRLEKFTLDDPDTEADEEKTTILYTKEN